MRSRLALAATLQLAAGCVAAQATMPITINDQVYVLPEDTPVLVDDEPRVLADLRYLPDGLQAQWITSAASAPNGVAPELVFAYTLIGPVTDTAPFAVLGQPLTITGDTVLAGFTDPATLGVGTPMVVSGLVDANGSLYATLVERRGAQGNKFLLAGFVQQTGPGQGELRIGEQWIDAGTLPFQDCAGGAPAVGEFVLLRAAAIVPFPPGSVLDTVTDARCSLAVPPGTPGAIGFVQGLITAEIAADRFALGGLTVVHDANTVFEFGTVDDLDLGAALMADGAYVDATTFAADTIEFVRPVVRFEAPLAPADVVPGVSIAPFGVVVRNSAQVRDEDGILANGLATPTQVEVRGWLDGTGQAYAFRVRERGNPDFNDTRLRGPVESIADPLLGIQGLTVDTTGATFFDHNDVAMTRGEFYAALVLDDLVDVSGALYDPGMDRLTGGIVILIGQEAFAAPRTPDGPADAVVAGTASGYALPDGLFSDGFETP